MTTSRPATYDRIGADYNRHRAAEPSVVRELARLLGLARGSMIADVGAGTGNYSNALAQLGYRVQAVEPSDLMRSQATPVPGVQWHAGAAEALPLPNNSVEGVICVLALHHFESLERAAAELGRVCPSGPKVFLTVDPRLGDAFWFSKYFPAIHKRLFVALPPIDDVCAQLAKNAGWTYEISEWFLPRKAIDITMHSGWNRPEIYLDPGYRRNMSGFALASPEEIEPGLIALQAALASGAWDHDYGHLRKQEEADLGFRFIKLTQTEAQRGAPVGRASLRSARP